MFRIVTPMLLGACILLSGLLVNTVDIQAGGKPLLSAAIRKAIDAHGATAAQKQFAKNYATHKTRYQVDMQGVAALGRSYAIAGNSPATQAVFAIANPYMASAAMVARNANANRDAKQRTAMAKEIKAVQKVRMKEFAEKQKRQVAEYRAADKKRLARYEAQRKPVFFKLGAAPIKPTPEDNWYIIRTLNVDAKDVTIMSIPADLHKAALAAGFTGTMAHTGSAYSKGPVRIITYFASGRNMIKTMRFELRDLSPARWQSFTKNIIRQLGSAGSSCIRRSGSVARLKCRFNYDARNYFAMVEISGTLRKGKGRIKLKFQQGP